MYVYNLNHIVRTRLWFIKLRLPVYILIEIYDMKLDYCGTANHNSFFLLRSLDPQKSLQSTTGCRYLIYTSRLIYSDITCILPHDLFCDAISVCVLRFGGYIIDLVHTHVWNIFCPSTMKLRVSKLELSPEMQEARFRLTQTFFDADVNIEPKMA